MIAIVGAGACGLVAALTLKDAGVDCVLLERDALPSGSTALSSGFIPACGTRWQEALGVEDSVEGFFSDIQKKNDNGANPEVAHAAVAAVGPALEWLADRHGIPFQLLEGFLYPGHSVARMHAVPEKTGAGLMGRLLSAAQEAGVDLLTHALVLDLNQKDLKIIRPDKSTETIPCDAILLACNGFGGNREMVRRYIPEIADAQYAGHAGNQGDAVRWGTALGAKLTDMGAYQGHGSWAVPHGKLLTWALMTEGGIQVNALGRRFADERQGYSEASQAVLAQPGRIAWSIYDERLHRLGQTFPDYVELHAAGAMRRAENVEELAFATGLPLIELKNEVQRFKPPYYAVKVTGALFHTQGGLEIDASARVLDARGRPLPNLYAAGGAARGLSGAGVWGYLSGNGLLSAVALGRIAGQAIAR
jgi:succinate dehydrogenase/fumarate reductase flavoprotein subunit